jgi:hypothetical protein
MTSSHLAAPSNFDIYKAHVERLEQQPLSVQQIAQKNIGDLKHFKI